MTSANNINSKRLYKSKCEDIVYKNYSSQINTYVSTKSSIIWDIVRVLKFKTRSKSMILLIIK